MANDFKDLTKLISYSEGGILSKVIQSDDSTNITLFCMSAKTSISEHTAKKKAIIYVIEGKGIFNLNDKKITMTPGVIIFLEKDAVHSLKADKNMSFTLSLYR